MEKRIFLCGDKESALGIPKTKAKSLLAELGVMPNEVWTLSELEGINSSIQDNEDLRAIFWDNSKESNSQGFIDYCNYKRAIIIKNKAIVVPQEKVGATSINKHHLNLVLLGIKAIRRLQLEYIILNTHDVQTKVAKMQEAMKEYESLKDSITKIQKDIVAEFLSKNFKKLYRFLTQGISTVGLPLISLSLDGVCLPKEYCERNNIKLGDKFIVKRDPVQNIFVTLTVEKIQGTCIRVHPRTMKLLDGDFDGDELRAISIKEMLSRNKQYIDNVSDVIAELNDIIPSKLLSNEKLMQLMEQYR